MIKHAFTLSVMVLGLTACTVGPDYHRPDVDIPRDWRAEQDVNAQTPMISTSRWWTVFNDPEMDRIVDIALAENKDIRIAAARVDQYWASFVVTDADRYPSVGLGANAGRTEYTQRGNPPLNPGVDHIRNDLQLNINAAFELDLWGKYRRASEAARASLLASEYARDNVILSLVAAVVQNYIDLRALDAQLDVARQTLESRAESLRLQQRRYEYGLTSELEYRQAEVEYQATAAMIPSLESQIQQKENALSILLGRNPGYVLRGLAIEEMTYVPEIPVGLPSDLLVRRPDIRQAEENLVAANARVGVAKAAYFPSISLTGFFGTQSASMSDLFSGPSRVWQYAGSLAMPIFDAGRIAGNVAYSEALREEMIATYQQTIQTAFREVDDALISIQKLNEQYEVQQKQLVASQRLMDLAQRRYDQGYVSYLEVLDAQRTLYDIQSTIVTTQQNRLNAYVNLNKVLGGGWVDFAAFSADEIAAPLVVEEAVVVTEQSPS